MNSIIDSVSLKVAQPAAGHQVSGSNVPFTVTGRLSQQGRSMALGEECHKKNPDTITVQSSDTHPLCVYISAPTVRNHLATRVPLGLGSSAVCRRSTIIRRPAEEVQSLY